MKDLLEYLVKNIVEQPEAVKVEETQTPEGFVNLQITVDPEDMGMVIGKGGRIIRALRNLVRVKAIKENKRVNVELTEIEQNPKSEILSSPPDSPSATRGRAGKQILNHKS